MSPTDELTVDQLEAINQVCVDFQSAWRAGRQPDLAEYRDKVAPELRGHLAGRLRAIADELRAPEPSAPDTRAPDLQAFPPNTPRSRRIGKYKLLQKIGEGGMGDVWVAEQTEGVQRTIAIKFVKLGLNSRQVLARFEHERQALAMMDHPNIAKVFDAGTDYPDSIRGDQAKEEGAGIPYFVMEHVKGVPITEYCDQAQLTPKERLELFIPVCRAVQHAHQKGIVHRDLKPSNVLVGLYDGKPVPKVIDFGVAKALHAKLTDKTMHTDIGGTIGTLLYMAPEQAGSDNLDIDTRADIYSLGVLLYELLTGASPFATRELGKIAYHEMVRHIKEVDPPKPSTRLSGSAELPSIASKRKLEPKRLSKLVSGDLDWIVMKCLEKDRGRRYETATQLGQELERFLSDEPVQAGPPSAAYRVRKFVRRNQGPVIAATLLLLALIAGIIGTSVGLVMAEQARAAEEDAAAAERQAKVIAQKRLGEIQKATDLLASMFKDVDPLKEAKGGPSLREQLAQRLEQIANELDAEAIADAATLARLQEFLGTTLMSVGNPKKAIALLTGVRAMRETTLGAEHPDTLTTMNNLAQAYHADGQLPKALALFEETLTRRKAKLGPDDSATLISMNNLALAYQSNGELAKALPLLEETLAKRLAIFGPDDPNTLVSTHNLAQAYHADRQFAKALPLFEETMVKLKAQFSLDHARTLVAMNNLALAYHEGGQLAKALPLFEETVAKCKDKLGPDHPETLVSMNNLAGAYQASGKLSKALSVYEEVLGRCQAKLGTDNPRTLTAMNNLASAYVADGQTARALPLYEEVLAKRKANLSPDHPDTLLSMNNLADGYLHAGQLAKATQLHEETLAARKAKLRPNHPDTLMSMTNLAVTHLYAKKPNEGIAILQEVLAVKRKLWGAADPRFADELATVGFELLFHEQHAAAEPLLRECLELRLKSQADDWTRFNTKAFLGGSLLGQKKYQEAETLLQEGYQGMKEREKAMPRRGASDLRLAERFLMQLFETAYEKKEMKLPGMLTDAKHIHTHELKLSKGKPVVIDMESKAFDTFLKLENAKGETLAENDDIDYQAKNLNSRILVTPAEDGTYRIIARSYQNEGRGEYTISVREFVAKRNP